MFAPVEGNSRPSSPPLNRHSPLVSPPLHALGARHSMPMSELGDSNRALSAMVSTGRLSHIEVVDPAQELRQLLSQQDPQHRQELPTHDGLTPSDTVPPSSIPDTTAKELPSGPDRDTACSASSLLPSHGTVPDNAIAGPVNLTDTKEVSTSVPTILIEGTDGGNATAAGSDSVGISFPFTSLLDVSLKLGESRDQMLGKSQHDDYPPLLKKEGSKSGRFTYFSTQTGPLESDNIHRLGDNVKMGSNHDKTNLESLLAVPCFWLDVTRPTKQEMKLLASIFRIHPLTTEDIQTDTTREKFELYRAYYFICYSVMDSNTYSEHYLEPFNVYILVYPKFVVSFHDYPLPSIHHVIRRLVQLKSYVEITPHWINYALLDDITDQYVPIIDSTQSEVDTIDDLVLILSVREQGDTLRRIANARKRVMMLHRLMTAKAEVVRVLLKRLESLTLIRDRRDVNVVSIKDTALYLGDVQDHIITMVQSLSETTSTLSRAHSNYLANITIEITQSANRTNESMTMLTAVASVLIPLNIITGLWGMNVKVPGQDADHLFWFFGILAVMMTIMLLGVSWVRWSGVLQIK